MFPRAYKTKFIALAFLSCVSFNFFNVLLAHTSHVYKQRYAELNQEGSSTNLEKLHDYVHLFEDVATDEQLSHKEKGELANIIYPSLKKLAEIELERLYQTPESMLEKDQLMALISEAQKRYASLTKNTPGGFWHFFQKRKKIIGLLGIPILGALGYALYKNKSDASSKKDGKKPKPGKLESTLPSPPTKPPTEQPPVPPQPSVTQSPTTQPTPTSLLSRPSERPAAPSTSDDSDSDEGQPGTSTTPLQTPATIIPPVTPPPPLQSNGSTIHLVGGTGLPHDHPSDEGQPATSPEEPTTASSKTENSASANPESPMPPAPTSQKSINPDANPKTTAPLLSSYSTSTHFIQAPFQSNIKPTPPKENDPEYKKRYIEDLLKKINGDFVVKWDNFKEDMDRFFNESEKKAFESALTLLQLTMPLSKVFDPHYVGPEKLSNLSVEQLSQLDTHLDLVIKARKKAVKNKMLESADTNNLWNSDRFQTILKWTDTSADKDFEEAHGFLKPDEKSILDLLKTHLQYYKGRNFKGGFHDFSSSMKKKSLKEFQKLIEDMENLRRAVERSKKEKNERKEAAELFKKDLDGITYLDALKSLIINNDNMPESALANEITALDNLKKILSKGSPIDKFSQPFQQKWETFTEEELEKIFKEVNALAPLAQKYNESLAKKLTSIKNTFKSNGLIEWETSNLEKMPYLMNGEKNIPYLMTKEEQDAYYSTSHFFKLLGDENSTIENFSQFKHYSIDISLLKHRESQLHVIIQAKKRTESLRDAYKKFTSIDYLWNGYVEWAIQNGKSKVFSAEDFQFYLLKNVALAYSNLFTQDCSITGDFSGCQCVERFKLKASDPVSKPFQDLIQLWATYKKQMNPNLPSAQEFKEKLIAEVERLISLNKDNHSRRKLSGWTSFIDKEFKQRIGTLDFKKFSEKRKKAYCDDLLKTCTSAIFFTFNAPDSNEGTLLNHIKDFKDFDIFTWLYKNVFNKAYSIIRTSTPEREEINIRHKKVIDLIASLKANLPAAKNQPPSEKQQSPSKSTPQGAAAGPTGKK